jgi:hypothetical protein
MKKKLAIVFIALGFGLADAPHCFAQGPVPPEAPSAKAPDVQQAPLAPPPGNIEDPNAPQRVPDAPFPVPKTPIPDPNKPIQEPNSPGMPAPAPAPR